MLRGLELKDTTLFLGDRVEVESLLNEAIEPGLVC